MIKRSFGAIGILFSVLALSACGGSSGGSDGGNGSTGTVSFAATDAPVDGVSAVQVTFDAIALQPQGGDRISPLNSIRRG